MLVKVQEPTGVKSIKITEAANGLSAYQLAVKNDGFEGDYVAWRDSINGDNFEYAWNGTKLGVKTDKEETFTEVELKGEKGDTGNDGYTPVKGVDYFDGDKGDTGAKGDIAIQGEYVSYPTLAAAQAVNPKPTNGTMFHVQEAANIGIYTFQSGSTGGTRYEKPIVLKEDITPVEALNDVASNFWSVYDGNGANSILKTGLTLENTGDSVEIDIKTTEYGFPGTATGMGVIGESGSSTSNIGVYNGGLFYIRSSAGTWLSTNAFLEPLSPYEVFTMKLVYTASNIDVYKNGVFQKSIAKGKIICNRLGDAYETSPKKSFQGELRNLKIINSTGTTEIKSLALSKLVTNKNLSLRIGSEGFLKLNQYYNTLSSTFYSFTASSKKFLIYTKIKDNYYAGFKVERITDLGDAYIDHYRLANCKLFTYTNNTFIDTNINLLTIGESESVYKVVGKSDHTGGMHGDETLISTNFYVNDVKIQSLSSDIPLTACKDFYYTQVSNTHTTDDPSHAIEAIHHKKTEFKSGGYKTNNRYIWQKNVTLEHYYHGIACTSKEVSKEGHNEFLDFVIFNEDGGDKLVKIGAREFQGNNITTGLATKVTSKLIKPLNQDANCTMFIWDNSNYHKYYREFKGVNPTTGDIWESEMEVYFNKL
jgi:hypothetical protein